MGKLPLSYLFAWCLGHTSSCECECEANLKSQGCVRSVFAGDERISTAANYSQLLRIICDDNMRFAFAGSMNRA